MTAAVDHTRDHDLTLQGNQAARAKALHHLLEISGLPTVSTWTIEDLSDRLSGFIYADYGQGSEVQRAKVQAWAEFLHADVTESTTGGRTTVAVEGREYGVRIRIAALLRAATTEEAAA